MRFSRFSLSDETDHEKRRLFDWIILTGLGFGLLIICFMWWYSPSSSVEMTDKTESWQQMAYLQIDWTKASTDARRYHISYEQVVAAVQNGAKFYDVRLAQDYQEGNLGITENISLTALQLGQFPTLSKETVIYLHCAKGQRSDQAAQLFRKAGFRYVYDLGGIEQVEAIGGHFHPDR